MRKKLLIFLLIIVVLGGGFFLIKRQNSAQTAMAEVMKVKLTEAKKEAIITKISADGTVEVKEERDIKARTSGLVQEIFVENGDLIKKGDKVLKLDERVINNSLETARLNLSEVEKTYQKQLSTYNRQDKINKLRLEEAERNLEIAQLSLKNERISLESKQENLQNSFKNAKEDLQKAETELSEKRNLYKNDAVSRKTLEEAEEVLKKAKNNYRKLEDELGLLLEKTIPTTLKLARLNVDNAKNQLDLLKVSIENDRITEEDLELAQIKIKKAKKQVEELEEDSKKLISYAPITGTIVDLTAKIGDKLVEGTTVGKMADIDNLIVEAMVDEIDVNDVKLGQEVEISSDAFEQQLAGKLIFVAPVGIKVGNINKYKTKIEIKDAQGFLKPGMFVNTEVITNKHDSVITIPSMAIMGEEEKYVFIAKDDKAEKRPVEISLKNLSKVEVSGVEVGEKIIIGPFTVLKKLKPGMPVVDIEINKTDKIN